MNGNYLYTAEWPSEAEMVFVRVTGSDCNPTDIQKRGSERCRGVIVFCNLRG